MKKNLVLFFSLSLFFLTATYTIAQTPVSPIDGASNITPGIGVTVSWTPFDDGNGVGPYDFDLSTDPLFGSFVAQGTVLGLPSYTFGGSLLESTTYYWRVRDADIDAAPGLQPGPWHEFTFITTSLLVAASNLSPDGATNLSLTPALSWDASTGGTTAYEYVVRIYDSNPTLIHTSAGQSGLTYNVPAALLNYGEAYTWTVQTTDQSSTPQIVTSAVASFSTVTELLPASNLAPNGLVNQSITPTLSWDDAVDGVAPYVYNVRIYSDVGLTALAYQANNQTSPHLVSIPLAYNTVYWWIVETTDQSVPTQTAVSTAATFKTDFPTLSLTGIADGSINTNGFPSLSWSTSSPVSNVEYILDATGPYAYNFSAPVTSPHVLTDGGNPLPQGTYTWNVTISDINTLVLDNVDEPSDNGPWTFDVFYPPAAPILNYPIDWDTLVSNTPTFVWTPVVTPYHAPSDSFRIQITPDPTFWFVEYTFNVTPGDTTFLMPTPLSNGSPYYWRVRGFNIAGGGPYSLPDTFRVSVSGDSTPPIPHASYPKDGLEIYITDPELRWYTLYTAAGAVFEIEFNDDGVFTGIPTYDNISGFAYPMTGLDNGETYYWKVRANRGGIYSEWSDSAYFSVVPATTPIVPMQSWPKMGTEIYSSTPTLYWYLNGNSTGLVFDVELSTSSTLTGVPTEADLNVFSWTVPTSLTAGQMYYWSVRSKNSSDSSAWAPVDSFLVVNNGVAWVPIISYPKGGETVYTTSTILAWYLNGYSTGLDYDIEVSTTFPLSGTPTVSAIDSNSYALTGLDYGVTYYWSVRTNDGTNNSAWAPTESFVVTGSGASAVPITSWPKGGVTVYSTTHNFTWHLNGPYLGITFDFQISSSPAFTSPIVNETGLLIGEYEHVGLVQGETYYWRARSDNGTSKSAWSTVETFSVYSGFAPARVFPGNPVGGLELNSSSPVLSWFLPTYAESVVSYELEYADNEEFANAVVIPDIAATFIPLTDLVTGSDYFWRVRSKNENGEFSNYSSTSNFKFNGVTSADEDELFIPEKFVVEQNYPNPFNPSTNISFVIPETGLVSVRIYDMLGQEVKTLMNDVLNAGRHSLLWNGDNNNGSKVASGTYIYRVQAGENVSNLKMLLLK